MGRCGCCEGRRRCGSQSIFAVMQSVAPHRVARTIGASLGVSSSTVGITVYDADTASPPPEAGAIPLAVTVIRRHASAELDPATVKRLLLQHVRACRNKQCYTCTKLRQRILVVRRRLAIWRRFRVGARVVGVLQLARARAAERIYLPGGVGFQSAQQDFEVRAAKQRRLS